MLKDTDRIPVVGYVRVSTEEQASGGVSLAAQREALRRYAHAQALELVEIVEDAGVSASVPLAKRPGGARVIELVEATGDCGVVAIKLDRLFRDAIDALETTRAWDRAGVPLHLVDMQVDTSTAMGRLFLTLMAAVAEMERNLIGERTAAALAQVRAEGGRIGRAGLGWRRTPDRDEHGRLAVATVDVEVATIERMRDLRASDLTYRQIASRLMEEGWPTKRGGRWQPGTVRRVLLRQPDSLPEAA